MPIIQPQENRFVRIPVEAAISAAEAEKTTAGRDNFVQIPLSQALEYSPHVEEEVPALPVRKNKEQENAPKEKPSGHGLAYRIAAPLYSGALEFATNFNKLIGLGAFEPTRKVFVERPERVIESLNKETASNSWVGKQANEFLRGIGNLGVAIPTLSSVGAATRLTAAATGLAKYLSEIPNFVLGAGATGAAEGYKEGGIGRAITKGAEEATVARLYTGPAKLTGKALERALTQGFKKAAARQLGKFTAIGVGKTIYDAAKEGRAPTQDELSTAVTQSAATALAFTALPVIEKITAVPRDKFELSRLNKKLEKAFKEKNPESAEKAIDDFFGNEKVSQQTKETLAGAILQAERTHEGGPIEIEGKPIPPEERMVIKPEGAPKSLLDRAKEKLAGWDQAERPFEERAVVEGRPVSPEEQMIIKAAGAKKKREGLILPHETMGPRVGGEFEPKPPKIPGPVLIEGKPISPEDRLIIRPKKDMSFLERAKLRVGGTPGIEETAAEKKPLIEIPSQTAGPREVIRKQEESLVVTKPNGRPFTSRQETIGILKLKRLSDRYEPVKVDGGWVGRLKGEPENAKRIGEASKVYEGVTEPEVPQGAGKEGKGVSAGRGVQGVRGGRQEEKAPEAKQTSVAKQPWEMTRDEWAKTQGGLVSGQSASKTIWLAKNLHSDYLKIWLKEGKPISAKAFEGYTLTEEQRPELIQAIRQALKKGNPVPRKVIEEYKGEKWADEALEKTEPGKKSAAKKVIVDNVDEFADQFDKMKRGRVIKILTKQQGFNGKFAKRKDYISKIVSEGWKIEINKKGERIIKSPYGTFFNESDITKTGMDYAEYLLNKQNKTKAAKPAALPSVETVPKSSEKAASAKKEKQLKKKYEKESQVRRKSQAQEKTRPGLTVDAVKMLIKPHVAKWKGIPKVEIVQSQTDHPLTRNLKGIIRGIYAENKNGEKRVVLIADNLSSKKDVIKTLLEEVVGHYGVKRGLQEIKIEGIDDMYSATLDAAWRTYRDDIQKVADSYRIDTKTKDGQHEAADEWIAKQIADESLPKRILNRIVMMFKTLARKMGFNINFGLTDVKDIARRAVEGRRQRISGKAEPIEKGPGKGKTKPVNADSEEFAVLTRYSLKQAVKKIIDNPNFRKWFGKSKVVDKNGEPLVVYHGTDEEFNVFDKEKLGWNTFGNANDPALAATSGIGFWFNSGEIRESKYFPGKRFMPVYLKIEKPYFFDSIDELADSLREYIRDASNGDYDVILSGAKKWVSSAKSDGYDGVIVNDEEFGGESYAVFSENQIKSIYNRGTFDPKNPDIRYSKLSEEESLKRAADILKKTAQEIPKISKAEDRKTGLFPFLGKAEKTRVGRFISAVKKDWVHEIFTPELLHEKGKLVESIAAHRIAQHTKAVEDIKRALSDRRKWWAGIPERARLEYIMAVESNDMAALKKLSAGDDSVYKLLTSIAKQHREMYDYVYEREKDAGLPVSYIKNYWVHMWENPEQAEAVFKKYRSSFGKDPFTKMRTIESVRFGLEHGLKLKTTNPEEMVIARLTAADKAVTRQMFVNDLVERGLAEKYVKGTEKTEKFNQVVSVDGQEYLVSKERAEKARGMSKAARIAYLRNVVKKKGLAKKYVRGSETLGRVAIDAPNGKTYLVPRELKPLITNAGMLAGEGQSLWVKETPGGKMYRELMKAKNIFIPIKLGMSLFHAVHIATIDMSARRTAIYEDLLNRGSDFKSNIGELAKVSLGLSEFGAVKEGMRIGKLLERPMEELSDVDKEAVRLILEGGFTTQMPHEWKVQAKENFENAIAQKNIPGIVGHGMKRLLELSAKPIFEVYVPALKRMAYLKRVQRLLARRPELNDDIDARRMELTKIRKSIDNQFGEMTYNTLFWNRMVKDIGIGSSLSMGWQLGFVREYGGGMVDTARAIKALVTKSGKPQITGRMLFVLDYTIQSMLIGGLITWALTGSMPNKLMDYFYPRSGDKNPDGSEMRFNTPFYTREFFAIAEHVRKEGVIKGLAQLVKNKSNPIIAPVIRMIENKDYYGTDIRDPHDPLVKQALQVAEYLGGEAMPIAASSMKRSMETMSFAKALISSELGFTKAPSYITMSKIQKEIFDEYSRYAGGGRTREQGKHNLAKRKLRVEFLKTGKIDPEHLAEAIKDGVFGKGPPKQVIANVRRFLRTAKLTSDIRVFKGLPTKTQLYLLKKMDKDDFRKYFRHAHRATKFILFKEQVAQKHHALEGAKP